MNRKWKMSALCLASAVGLTCTANAETRVLPTDLTNIAAAANGGHVVGATSTLDNDAKFKASNLIDGQAWNAISGTGSAGWASNKFDPAIRDEVTLGFAGNEIKRIGKLVFNPSTSLNPERWAKDIEVQVSTNTAEGPYRAIAQITLKRSPEAQSFAILPADARFVRLNFRSNWGSDRAVGLGEVEIYEAIDTSDPMGGVIARLESTIEDLKTYKTTQNEVQNSLATRANAPAPRANASQLKPVSLNSKNLRPIQAPSGAPNAGGGNIAAAKNGGKIVDVSSVFDNDPKFSADNLIDGQNYSLADQTGSFGWASEGFAPGRQYVTIGFRDDRSHLINKVVINPISNQSTLRWASRVEVQVTMGSPTDGPFRIAETFNVNPDPKAANQEFAMRPVEAKYVRFVFTANGPGNPSPKGDPNVSSNRAVALGEIEIYEPLVSSGDLEALIGRFNQVLIDLKELRPKAAAAVQAAAPPVEAPAALDTPAETPAAPANASAPKTKPAARPVVAKAPRNAAPKQNKARTLAEAPRR